MTSARTLPRASAANAPSMDRIVDHTGRRQAESDPGIEDRYFTFAARNWIGCSLVPANSLPKVTVSPIE